MLNWITSVPASGWSAIAAGFSAIATIISVFISYKSFNHQKTKDEINLKPNLFLKGKEFKIYNNVRYYFDNIFEDIDLIETYPFKFIELRNISNEPIVDITVKCHYESHYKYEKIQKLEKEINNVKILYGNLNNLKSLNLESQDSFNEKTKIPILEKNEKGLISLPNGLWIDLWQDFIAHDHENLKNKNYCINFDISYSHSYSENPVHFTKKIVFTKIIDREIKYNSKNTFKYETYVFPKL